MTDRDRTKLQFGPYKAPPLKRGDRAACLYGQKVLAGTVVVRVAAGHLQGLVRHSTRASSSARLAAW
jgi:hypothetical protein